MRDFSAGALSSSWVGWVVGKSRRWNLRRRSRLGAVALQVPDPDEFRRCCYYYLAGHHGEESQRRT